MLVILTSPHTAHSTLWTMEGRFGIGHPNIAYGAMIFRKGYLTIKADIGLARLESMTRLAYDVGYGISIHGYFALGSGSSSISGVFVVIRHRRCRVRHDIIMTQSTSKGTLAAWCDDVAFTFVVDAGHDCFLCGFFVDCNVCRWYVMEGGDIVGGTVVVLIIDWLIVLHEIIGGVVNAVVVAVVIIVVMNAQWWQNRTNSFIAIISIFTFTPTCDRRSRHSRRRTIHELLNLQSSFQVGECRIPHYWLDFSSPFRCGRCCCCCCSGSIGGGWRWRNQAAAVGSYIILSIFFWGVVDAPCVLSLIAHVFAVICAWRRCVKENIPPKWYFSRCSLASSREEGASDTQT